MGLPLAGLLGKFSSQTASETLGFGVGVSLAEALRPEATQLGQAAWAINPSKAVDPELAAAIVAEDVELEAWGADEAAQGGISGPRFAAILGEVLNAPGLGELLVLWRRGAISEADFVHGLRKAKLELRWDEGLQTLKEERLEPATIATAVQRGVLENAGLLPVGPPSEAGQVPPMPTVALDPIAEAAGHGYSEERLAVLARIVGLPPGPHELLELLNRGVIEEADYLRGIAEGNTRNEWAPYFRELARRLLTPHEYAEAQLRGLRSPAEREQGAGLSGMTADDSELLFELLGRPLAVRQITTGEARGGHYGGNYEGVPEPYLDAIRRSAVRPEYGNLAYANRYTYPSAFVLRALTQAGEVTGAEAEEVLLFQGWEPGFAHKVAVSWSGSAAGAGKAETKAELEDEYEGGFITEAEYRAALAALGYSGQAQDLLVHIGDARRTKRYRDKAIDAVGAAYTNFKVDDTRATSELAELNVTGAARDMLLAVWRKQRLDSIRLLTPAQIKKAYAKGLITQAVALDSLEWEHMTPADAALFLAE